MELSSSLAASAVPVIRDKGLLSPDKAPLSLSLPEDTTQFDFDD